MSDTNVVKGYKVFNPDWTCKGKQYTCPGKFEEDVSVSVCGKGMHFCKKAVDCFNYYSFDPKNKAAEVIAYGDIEEGDNKCCTDKLEIVREIPWAELLEIVNTGKGNTGLCNSGDRNSGNYNSGDRNSGNYNSGNYNSGSYNKTNYSNGWFNTIEPKITMFNKISKWTEREAVNSEANAILNFLAGNVCEWIYSQDMTDEEKEKHPEHKTAGGYLKKHCIWENAAYRWSKLSRKEKDTVMSIPNFNKNIFKEITGIDVRRFKNE